MRNIIVHKTIASIRDARSAALKLHQSVGFVPTMGALHAGHLSLVERARDENDLVVASIFVNPKQFGPNEDLAKYPRQLERDVELLESMGVHHVFAPPSINVMYGPNFCTQVNPTGFDETHEGQVRPGHFAGVATVVTKLFNIVQPTRAYFGQKDAVQCVLIRRIVQDLDIPVEIRVMDTVREPDGLAMSSRNAYLTPEERAAAPIIYKALCAAKHIYTSKPNCSTSEIQTIIQTILESNPLVSEIQYIAVDDHDTMKPLENVGPNGAIVSLACRIGNVRLIDNMILR